MYKRKPRNKNSFLLLSSSNRGSDIVKPENTSLIVNDSESDDELPKELTSVLTEEEVGFSNRNSASLMESLSQKTQSTPKETLSNPGRVLRELNYKKSQKIPGKREVPRGLPKVVSQPVKKNKNNYFEEVLKDCGAFPNAGNTYLMREDQGVFSMKVNKKLSENDENVKKFLSSLEEEIENPENFKKMLTHTLTADDCDVARAPVQEPLMRMLLNVDCLQSSLFNLLLEKLANIVLDGGVQKEDSHFISSILCQCRFLNRTKDAGITSKLFEIIQVAPVNVQKEIIFLLPEIVTEEEAEATCNQLLELIKLDKRLTNVVVDAIANLPLSGFAMAQARTKMLCRLDKCPSEFLPSLVQFVLNKCGNENLMQIICDLRESLPFTVKHFQIKTQEEKNCSEGERFKEDSYIKLTFENLKFSVMVSREMADAWIKVIAGVNSSAEFRCLDLVMLIIFYSCLAGRKSQVLSLIRNKIKSSILTEVHVQHMFKILLEIAREYFSSLLELASVFLKSFEKKISDFGAVLYKECFLHFNFFKKQTLVSEILLHVGTGSPETVNAALDIIKNLSENETEVLSKHTVSIMGLLVKIHDLSLVQVRVLLDIISELIFYKSTEETIGWRDELHIFIQKQLSSSKFDHCKKGIVGAVMFGKHAEKKRENGVIDCTQINSLLEMAMGSNRTSQARKSFFNDEFATTVRNSQLNECFLETWNDKVFNIVTNNLLVQNIDVECEHFPMSLQYSLHIGDGKKFVFPVVKFVIDSDSSHPMNAPLSVIPSTLRLLWSFKENFKRNLPVFCASVIMPEVSSLDNFDEFSWKQRKIIVDCLFLCANYLIECVNAFCSQEIMDKALLRIRQLVNVRKLIVKCLHDFSDYSPPFCQFYMSVQKVVVKKKKVEKKVKKGRKRKSNDVESDLSNQSAEVEESQIPGTSSHDSLEISQDWEEGNLQLYRGYFREFHTFTYKLLKIDFSLNVSEVTKGNVDSLSLQHHPRMTMEKLELNVSEVLFLLEELLYKLENTLKESKRSFAFKSKPCISTVEHITPENFVAFSVEILPKLLTDVEILSSYCEKLLEANDWIYDSQGICMQGTHDIKLALANALKFISEIISWKGFKNCSNQTLLKDVLTVLSRKRFEDDISTNSTIPCLALEAANYLEGFSKNVLILDGGLSIVKAYEACLQFSASHQHFSNLAELCFKILSRPWFTVAGVAEKGPNYNQNVDILLKTYFANVDNKLEVVRNTARLTLNEIERPSETGSFLNSVKAINKSNFPLLYRAMCETLVSASTTQLETIEGNTQLSLEIWTKIVDTWLVLVEIVKIHSSRVNLASLLKRSQSMIQLFLSKGMPLVESALRVKSSEILKLLKYLQTVTRFLHSVCCHSKLTNDSIVAAHVPAIRSQCERLTLEIKGVLILNNIPMDCITIAILKNRDLKGNDILSQESVDDNSEDDFEFPPEDTPMDDDNNDNSGMETQESASEVY